MQSTAVAMLVRWHPNQLIWGLMRLPLASLRPPQRPQASSGLLFQKFLGSGQNGGFQVTPSLDHQAWFGVFSSEQKAHHFIEHSPMVADYQRHAQDWLILTLQAYQTRGSWSGFSLQADHAQAVAGRVVSLTRASIRPIKAIDFWRQSPDAEQDLKLAEGCELAIGSSGVSVPGSPGSSGTSGSSGTAGSSGTSGRSFAKFTGLIGDGATNPITVTHSLGTLDVSVHIREVVSGDLVYPYTDNTGDNTKDYTVVAASTNTVTMTFVSAPGTNQHQVIILG